jgi:hypothetical protein
MILAERLCLLALDPDNGRDRPTLDPSRYATALAGLVLADLAFAGRLRIDAKQVRMVDAMPVSHPVLSDAAHRLAARGALDPLAALGLLVQQAKGWHGRMRKALAARDILETYAPFPFMRRYRLRSRQAWNESTDLLKSVGTAQGPQRDIALVFAVATHACGVLAEVLDAPGARAVLSALPTDTLPPPGAEAIAPQMLLRLIRSG